jgi:alkylation response protein AidB-like acyl-CoA dehydrogenase
LQSLPLNAPLPQLHLAKAISQNFTQDRGIKMNFLKQERRLLKEFFPTLDETLAALPLQELEQRGNPTLQIFRKVGGPGLLIPKVYGGMEATPLQAVRIQRAIACRAPSLSIATTMHHFSVATIVEMIANKAGTGLEWMILEGIAKQNLYVASGFAEGQTGKGTLKPTMRAKRTAKGLIVNGSKKPCSLSASMDLLTASVAIPDESGKGSKLAVVMIPAKSEGLELRPFWSSPVLAGAESDEVILRDVHVPEQLVSYTGNSENLDFVQTRGFLWFELLASASYVGIASALIERVLTSDRGTPTERAMLGIEIEGAMSAIEGVAQSMDINQQGNDELARSLFVRYAVQRAIEHATSRAVELLGGMAFINSPEVAYFLSTVHALAFHPPSRLSMSTALDSYLSGEFLFMQ